MELLLLANEYSVCRLPATSAPPPPPVAAELYTLTVTAEEVSVVCRSGAEPPGAKVENGFSALRVAGALDFSLVGILASLTAPLAEVRVSVFALSTFDTDYLLVRTADLPEAKAALEAHGHVIGTGA
ncbi:ACT domain-containing protein [Nonomuraea sp. NPDC059007]|uniref:ACT domain-containing protein n=1 Tax=Nonomuraea sp. NPDC059007 TaxID=3346692 RepID=UPI0036C64A3C